jgi:hypothetical protein
MSSIAPAASRFGMAWIGLTLALAVHVADEALTGFLAVYNPTVQAIRRLVPLLPLPVFTFRLWLSLLVAAVCVLLALSVFSFRGARWMVPLAYVFGVVMLGNGLVHLAGSGYLRRPMPGVYSSPLLLAGAVYLLSRARRFRATW